MNESSRNASDDNLSIAERIILVQDIWDSVAAEQDDLVLNESQRAELDTRMAEHLASPDEGNSWEQIKHRLSQK
jgi:putative addiction module component (TIGR02574 family)